MPLHGVAGGTGLCIPCTRDPLPLAWCEAWGEYRDGLERVLHAFKFQRHDFLDAPLAGKLAEVARDRQFDAIVPVPMHPARKRRRGYNQAELLARALAKTIAVPCELTLLKKIAEKRTQSTLARAERVANVRGVFEASPRARDLSILLVDDICTTGETLRACATELANAGATRIAAVSVAKAV